MAESRQLNPDEEEKLKRYFENKEKRSEKSRQDRKTLGEKCKTLAEARLCETLEGALPDYYWHLEYHPEGMDGRQRVDIVGEPNSRDQFVFIEIERGVGKTHPIDNMIKAWRYIDDNADSKPVLLIQLFSPYFYSNSVRKRRRNETVFIGKQAEKATSGKLRYEPVGQELGQKYWPQSKESNLDTLIDKISSLIGYKRNK
jgi:hypothetical protein